MILFISSAGLSACSTVPRKGNPAYPRLHNGWNIRYGYSTDGYYRKVYILLLHPVMIAVYPSSPNIGLRFFLVVV